MTDQIQPNRCRLVLVAPRLTGTGRDLRIVDALAGGDVASLILPVDSLDEATFQAWAEPLVEPAQAHGAAVVIAGPPRLAFRLKADGVHVEDSKTELAEIIGKHHGRMIVGCGGVRTRDEALELGETQPDYVFFGRFFYDNKPEPHPRNLTLGRWWAEMVSLPCIVLGGCEVASVEAVAATRADFVALSEAVFADGADPAAAVARANALLDERAPGFEDRG